LKQELIVEFRKELQTFKADIISCNKFNFFKEKFNFYLNIFDPVWTLSDSFLTQVSVVFEKNFKQNSFINFLTRTFIDYHLVDCVTILAYYLKILFLKNNRL
jgi:hypothetical protein